MYFIDIKKIISFILTTFYFIFKLKFLKKYNYIFYKKYVTNLLNI